jgi:hypothetical protein
MEHMPYRDHTGNPLHLVVPVSQNLCVYKLILVYKK